MLFTGDDHMHSLALDRAPARGRWLTQERVCAQRQHLVDAAAACTKWTAVGRDREQSGADEAVRAAVEVVAQRRSLAMTP